MEKIGVIGQGFVGSAVCEGMKNYYDVKTFDINGNCNEPSLDELISQVNETFLCVPTPMKKSGECDLSIVKECLQDILNIVEYYQKENFIVILKSTIPPGTTEKLNQEFKNIHIAFNPEFLTEANAVNDWKNQNRIILGGLNKVTAKVIPIFKKVFPQIPIVKTDSKYAEMVKYVINTFLATKVSFANEIYQMCEAMEIDYDKVIEYAQHDTRLGNSHWSVPGPDGSFGFGGHCFPKDTQALMFSAFQMGITPIMLAATITKNDEVRGDRNWEKMDGRAVIKSNNFETVENFASLEDMRNGIETHIAGSAEVEDKNQLKLEL